VAYKSPPAFQAGEQDPFPPSPRELLELSTHPFVTHVLIFKIKSLDVSLLSPRRDHLENGTHNLDHHVLADAENTDTWLS
jgi:hypothetical protein